MNEANKGEADVIVLGAGPAGCAAAIRARQADLRVVMLDAGARPRAAPGETLHPGIEPVLKQLDVVDEVLKAGFRRHRGVWLESYSKRRFAPYGEDADGPWLGFQANRRTLHRILQQSAVEAGAKLIRNTRPKSVLTKGNRVTGVLIGRDPLRAAWTVDATGRYAWLAEELGIAVNVRSPPLAARFGWRDGEPSGLEGQPSFVFRDNGWDWQAPVGEDRTAWVELRIGKAGGHSLPSAPFRRKPAGIDLTWRHRPRCAGPGFFLVGDAAAMLDPSSSHGVLRALMSGLLAGHLMAGCCRAGFEVATAIETYRSWVGAQFEHDERRLRQHYTSSPAGRRFAAANFSFEHSKDGGPVPASNT